MSRLKQTAFFFVFIQKASLSKSRDLTTETIPPILIESRHLVLAFSFHHCDILPASLMSIGNPLIPHIVYCFRCSFVFTFFIDKMPSQTGDHFVILNPIAKPTASSPFFFQSKSLVAYNTR